MILVHWTLKMKMSTPIAQLPSQTGTLASQTRRNNKRKIAVHTIYSLEYIGVEKPDNDGKY